jgi:MerR family transcriptional regulator, light-induced transcriptional regulator
VSTDLLRKWERRYAVLKPGRTIGNRRVYSQLDEARARVMLRHVRDGVPAAQAAELAIATRFRIAAGATSETTTDQLFVARVEMQAGARALRRDDREQALEKLFASAGPAGIIRDVFLPYLHEIGDRWADGHLNVAQEHFASGFIHSRLIALARGWDRGLGPRLLACAPGDQHTIGLIAFGIAREPAVPPTQTRLATAVAGRGDSSRNDASVLSRRAGTSCSITRARRLLGW